MSTLHVYCHVRHLNEKGLDLGELGFQSGKRINIRKRSCFQEALGLKGEDVNHYTWAVGQSSNTCSLR
jgi:hypothetical protein